MAGIPLPRLSEPFKEEGEAPSPVLDALSRLSNQLPPRLKALLNLTISVVLVLLAVPLAWAGLVERDWPSVSLGAGLLLLGVFNLFT